MIRPAAAALLSVLASSVPAVDIPARGTDQIAHFCVVAFGGADRWRQVRDIRYTQVVTRYGPGNKVWSQRSSEVFLRYRSRQQCRIESRTREGNLHVLVYDGEKVRVEVDGREDTDPAAMRRARRLALSTLYLSSLPFRMQDEGVVLTYRGKGKLGGRDVYRLEAAVRSGGSASPADTYEYYIDAETFQVPQLVYTIAADNVSYIVRWSEVRNFEGILRPLRWDYMAGPEQRAMTVDFSNFKLNSGLPDSLFQTRAPSVRRGRSAGAPATQTAPGRPSAPGVPASVPSN